VSRHRIAVLGAAIALGASLFATASDKSTSVAFAPWMVAGSGGLAMNGAW
jgi:hypothetical protein